MADYGKYAMSAPFARLLDEFVIEEYDDGASVEPTIVHLNCDMPVVELTDDTDMRRLVQAVIDHDCP